MDGLRVISANTAGADQRSKSLACSGYLILSLARRASASGKQPTSVREPNIDTSLRVNSSPGRLTWTPLATSPTMTILPPAATRSIVDCITVGLPVSDIEHKDFFQSRCKGPLHRCRLRSRRSPHLSAPVLELARSPNSIHVAPRKSQPSRYFEALAGPLSRITNPRDEIASTTGLATSMRTTSSSASARKLPNTLPIAPAPRMAVFIKRGAD